MVMIKIEEVKQLANRWYENVGPRATEYAPDAKVVTGDLRVDIALHHFEKDSGLQVKLGKVGIAYRIEEYEIIDEGRFTWFMLRWA